MCGRIISIGFLFLILTTIPTNALICHHFGKSIECASVCVTETFTIDDKTKIIQRCANTHKPAVLFKSSHELFLSEFTTMNGVVGGLDIKFCNHRNFCNSSHLFAASYALILCLVSIAILFIFKTEC